MPDSFTLNYNFTKPEVNASRDTWGSKDNGNWDSVDAILKNIDTSKINKSGDTVAGAITWTGQHNFNGPVPLIGGNPIVTKAVLAQIINAIEPIGTVKMFYGNPVSIPQGWALCNGLSGTPNMLDRFPVMAGNSYALGAIGGSTIHDHGGVTAGHAITIAEMPSHGHGVVDPSHGHSINDPTHAHNYNQFTDNGATIVGAATGATAVQLSGDNAVQLTSYSGTGIGVLGAFTGISISSTGGGASHLHGIVSSNHLPPYFGIYFIYKYAATIIV